MSLPGSNDLIGMDYAFEAQPFVQIPAKAEAGPLDLSFNAEPFLPANLPINIYGDSSGCTSVALSTDVYDVYRWQTSPDNSTWSDIVLATSSTYSVVSTAYYRISARVTISDPWLYSNGLFVTIYVAPIMGIIGDSSDCTSVTLTATGSDIVTYQWAKDGNPIGVNSDTYVATESGSYTVAGTNSNGCYGISSTHAVVIYSFPTISIIGDASGCDSISLSTASSGVNSYQWKLDGVIISGAESSTYIATVSGNYTVVGTSVNSCAMESNSHAVIVYVAPSAPTINVSFYTLSVPDIYISYQWRLEGVDIFSATTFTYLAGLPGNYSVLVTDSNGCSVISEEVYLTMDAYISITPDSLGPATLSALWPGKTIARTYWFLDNIMLFDTTEELFLPTAPGYYKAAMQSIDNFTTMTSNIYVASSYVNQEPGLILNGSVSTGSILSRYTDIMFDVIDSTDRAIPISYINFFVYQNGGLLETLTKDSSYVSYSEISNGWRFIINGPTVNPKYRFKNGSVIEVKVMITN